MVKLAKLLQKFYDLQINLYIFHYNLSSDLANKAQFIKTLPSLYMKVFLQRFLIF